MSAAIPHSEATEQSLLGAVLLKPEIMAWLDASAESFYAPQNQAIWRAMEALRARGMAIDVVTLEAELEARGVLEAAGGLAYLGKLAIACATSSNADTYARTLEQLRIKRDVIRIAGEVRDDQELTGEELLDRAMHQLNGIRRAKANELTATEDTIGNMLIQILEDVEAQAKGAAGTSYIATGIAEVDHVLGGVPLGTVTVVGARPAGGKSSTLLNLAEHAAGLGKVAAIFTTEDPRDRWQERLLAKHSGVPVDRIYMRNLSRLEMADVMQAADRVKQIEGLHIVHAHGMTAQEMTRVAMVLGAELVGIDYVQKVRKPDPRMKIHEAIEESSKVFGDYAGKSGAAVVVLSQLSKEVEKEDRRPRLSDLRYGDGLAQEAKLALLLHRPSGGSDPQAREFLVAKRNQGETDQVIRVSFDGERCTFTGRRYPAAVPQDRGGDF